MSIRWRTGSPGAVRPMLVLAAVVTLSGCGDGGGFAGKDRAKKPMSAANAPDTRPPAAAKIRLTRTGDAPAGCGPREVARQLVRLFAASNSGSARAAAFFAPEAAAGYGWWSVNGGGGEAITATDRSQLQRYLAARHAQQERYDLREVRVRPRQEEGIVDLEVKLARTASDLRRIGSQAWNTEGKGALHCDTGRVIVWSVTTSPDEELTDPVCPRFSRRPRTITACLTA